MERYRPSKLVVDSSGRIHVVAINVNEGIVEFDPDGKFEGFLAAVSGARAMRGAAIGSIAIAVMGGVMGLLVLTFLTFLGATLSASCWNLFLYTLLWLVPGILITSLSSRR